MHKLAALLSSQLGWIALIPVVFGLGYAVDCRRVATAPDDLQGCWKTGLSMAGIGGGVLAGFNIPNPRLDKPRHELALELAQRGLAAAAPPPPEPELPAALEILPDGWQRDLNGRLHDELGHYVRERR
ncbi:MAG: hypothetical protein AAFX65_10720 [Cyanobacteria bacterium J06638_7]